MSRLWPNTENKLWTPQRPGCIRLSQWPVSRFALPAPTGTGSTAQIGKHKFKAKSDQFCPSPSLQLCLAASPSLAIPTPASGFWSPSPPIELPASETFSLSKTNPAVCILTPSLSIRRFLAFLDTLGRSPISVKLRAVNPQEYLVLFCFYLLMIHSLKTSLIFPFSIFYWKHSP